MAASMPSLCDDLLAETALLDALVRPLDTAGWQTPTAAPGWTVHDQVAHLAHFDEDARIGAVDPERFASMREEVLKDVDAFVTERHDPVLVARMDGGPGWTVAPDGR